MSAKRKKLVELNLDQKKEVLDWLDKGVTQRCLAAEFGVAKGTIVNINKNRDTILKSWEDGSHGERKRKLRKTENEPVNILVLEFLKKCRAMNIAVTGPMLQTMAKDVAQRLNLEEFQASNGWLASFKERNNVHFRSVPISKNPSVPGTDVEVTATENWKMKLEHLLKKYPPENQFNVGETGLFFRKLPTKNMPCDDQRCKYGEQAKERLTILFCCSAKGEKLKPLVIGNCAKPQVFKSDNVNVEPDQLPVMWSFNEKAWMTRTIFETWLQSLNRKMKKEGRNIVLLVGNSTCHHGSREMSNVVVKFIPPNLATNVQPMGRGILRAVRTRYRSMMLQCLVTNASDMKSVAEFAETVTVLDAIRWINGAWREVPEETILDCFKRAGFYDTLTFEDFHDTPTSFVETVQALPSHIQNELALVRDIVEFDSGLTLHEEVQTSASEIAEEVLDTFKGKASRVVNNKEYGEDDDDDEEEEEDNNEKEDRDDCESKPSSPPSHKEALQHVTCLMKYAAAHQPSLIETLLNLYTSIEVQWAATEMNSTQNNFT